MSDSVGSVAVEVVPDASGWSEKLRAQIRDYTAEVRVEADTTEADAKLDADVARLVDQAQRALDQLVWRDGAGDGSASL